MKKLYIYPFCLFILSFLILNNVQAQTTCPPIGDSKIESIGQVTVVEPDLTTPGTGSEGQSMAMTDERMIYWVHGMGGNRGSWQNAIAATQNNIVLDYPARKAICAAAAYDHSAEFIINAATTIQNTIKPSIVDLGLDYDNHRSILIAHSMGGIVARELDGIYMDDPIKRRVGGMAFFGTPHLGAPGLEDAQERARQFMGRSAADLAAYQVTSLTTANNNLIFRQIARYFQLDSWIEAAVEEAFVEIGGLLFNGLTSSSVSELVEGSETINTLNARTTNIPMIPYYGVFNDYTATVDGAPLRIETIWASLQYMFQTPNARPHFTATNFEHELQQTMNAVRSRYIASSISEQAAADEFISSENINNCLNTGNIAGIFFTPYFGSFIGATCVNNLMSSNAAALQRRDAALRGARWFDTVNDQYKVLIGAREAEPVSNVVTKCICNAPTWLEPVITIVDPSTQTCPNDYNDFNVTCDLVQEVEVTGHQWVEHPSDGLVLASSAGGLPTHLIADQVIPRPMFGSSHFGMRNDDNLKNELKALFDGGVDDFFATDEK